MKNKKLSENVYVRFLNREDNGVTVMPTDAEHPDGYYEFLVPIGTKNEFLSYKDNKELILGYFMDESNRAFFEYLILEIGINAVNVISMKFEKDNKVHEFTFLEEDLLNAYFIDGVSIVYSEEFGKMSDFDYYPHGLV